MVYKWYILPIWWLCTTYHLWREPETAIDAGCICGYVFPDDAVSLRNRSILTSNWNVARDCVVACDFSQPKNAGISTLGARHWTMSKWKETQSLMKRSVVGTSKSITCQAFSQVKLFHTTSQTLLQTSKIICWSLNSWRNQTSFAHHDHNMYTFHNDIIGFFFNSAIYFPSKLTPPRDTSRRNPPRLQPSALVSNARYPYRYKYI